MIELNLVKFACGRYGVKEAGTNIYYDKKMGRWHLTEYVDIYCKFKTINEAEKLKKKIILCHKPVEVLEDECSIEEKPKKGLIDKLLSLFK